MKRTYSADGWATWFAAIAILVLAAAGCEEKVYQIEQWPREDKLWRRLTVSRQQGKGAPQDLNNFDKAEIARIAQLYGVGAPKMAGSRATFVGAFASALPHDVGGDGHYVHWESPLGSVSIYVERFRGSDDLVATLETRRKTVDQLVDLVIGWFEAELRDVPDWPALRRFLDVAFRHDLYNLSLYGWLTGTLPESESKNPEFAFRVIQYLVEKRYASYEEAPALVREIDGMFRRNESGPFFTRLRRLLLARAAAPADGPLARGLDFLKNPTTAWASWRHYLEKTPFYERELAEFRRRKEEDEHQKAKTGGPALANAAEQKREPPIAIDKEEFAREVSFKFLNAFIDFGMGGSSLAKVSLETPRKPFWTNGKYNANEHRVEWSQRIPEASRSANWPSSEWPGFCCAAWDDPNEQAQNHLLGKVGITRESLFQYNLWYQSLSNHEKHEWDVFLPTVRGDAKSGERLEGFLFSDEPAGRKGSERVAATGATAILEVVGPPERGGAQVWVNGVPLLRNSPEGSKDVDPRD
jgi:hypothetical protein